MRSYWVKFVGREAACVEGHENFSVYDAAALALKLTGCRVENVAQIPHPALPQLNFRGVPAMCYTPEDCSGMSACPKGYACSE